MGKWLIQHQGTSWLCCFPFADAMERGSSLAGAETWAAELSTKDFTTFADKSIRAALLYPGCVAWVPYGWAPYLVAAANQTTPPVTLLAPYFEESMATQYQFIGQVCQHNQGIWQQNNNREPWKSCKEFIPWLQRIAAQAASKVTGHPPEQPSDSQAATQQPQEEEEEQVLDVN